MVNIMPLKPFFVDFDTVISWVSYVTCDTKITQKQFCWQEIEFIVVYDQYWCLLVTLNRVNKLLKGRFVDSWLRVTHLGKLSDAGSETFLLVFIHDSAADINFFESHGIFLRLTLLTLHSLSFLTLFDQMLLRQFPNLLLFFNIFRHWYTFPAQISRFLWFSFSNLLLLFQDASCIFFLKLKTFISLFMIWYENFHNVIWQFFFLMIFL